MIDDNIDIKKYRNFGIVFMILVISILIIWAVSL